MLLTDQRLLYEEKNAHLQQKYAQVSPYEFYRFLFPAGEFEQHGRYDDYKPNGIALEIAAEGKATRYTITDDLDVIDTLQGTDFSIISPISYFGKQRKGRNARYLYAMVFDLDGVGMPQLRDTLYQMNKGILPNATFVVNSGTGLHLYYVLDKPIPMYPRNQKYLKELKYALTRQIWNRYTSTIKEPQMQGVMQGFRVVGSSSKLGSDYPVVAFRSGERITLEELINYIPETSGERQKAQDILKHSSISLEKAKELYPDWYERRILNNEKRGRWIVKRDLYDWWLDRIRTEIRVGHRFYGIMTLAIYAKKCNIDEDELRRDAFSLLTPYDEMSEEDINRFTEDDIICALEMFNEDYVTFPRDDIARLAGVSMPVNKRNGQKQRYHLEEARAIRDIRQHRQNREWYENSPHSGRNPKNEVVKQWRLDHPNGKKIDCYRDTGLSRTTINKWWEV